MIIVSYRLLVLLEVRVSVASPNIPTGILRIEFEHPFTHCECFLILPGLGVSLSFLQPLLFELNLSCDPIRVVGCQTQRFFYKADHFTPLTLQGEQIKILAQDRQTLLLVAHQSERRFKSFLGLLDLSFFTKSHSLHAIDVGRDGNRRSLEQERCFPKHIQPVLSSESGFNQWGDLLDKNSIRIVGRSLNTGGTDALAQIG